MRSLALGRTRPLPAIVPTQLLSHLSTNISTGLLIECHLIIAADEGADPFMPYHFMKMIDTRPPEFAIQHQ